MTGRARALWQVACDMLAAARRQLRPASVPDLPHMPAVETEAFEDLLRGSRIILEYGAGGSTVLASRFARRIVSVDNDARYLEAVRSRAAANGCEFIPVHVPLGLTDPYGTPLLKEPTPSRLRRWSRYPKAPWEFFVRSGELPDLVFIDGRFRVACVLESLMRLGRGSDAVFILDDFRDRGHYRAIEPFIRDPKLVGRLLIFRIAAEFDARACRSAQAVYLADWR